MKTTPVTWFGKVTFVLLLASSAPRLEAGPRVHIVTGPNAPALEKLAAEELAVQLRQLFEAEVSAGDKVPAGVPHKIFLGNPATNPALKAVAKDWPKLSDQGHLLKSLKTRDGSVLAVGGGSPVATLWGVYELGQRWGIRYMLYGDVYPNDAPEFKLDQFDVVLEPTLRVRTWRTINDFAIGPESWGLDEQQRVLRQLAKLKFNRILLAMYPWQPFVDFEFKGVHKESAMLWYGYKYPVSGETAGRGAFGGARVFDNPDFAGQESYAQRIAAGTKLASGIIDTARQLGMTTAIAISPLEFPKEFAAALPGAQTIYGLENLTIGPGPKQSPDDPLLLDLVKSQIRAYLKTYPQVDALYLTLPEFPGWGEHAEMSWKRIDERTGVGKIVQLKQLVAAARDRKLIASGDRGEKALRGNITALDFFHTLLSDRDLLHGASSRRVQPVIVDVDTALYPILDKVLPAGAETLNLIDYTARRVVENREFISRIPAGKVASSLILTLADDNVGVLPQMATGRLHELVHDLRAAGWQGFSTRYWIVGDLDWSTYYLSRASFDPTITPARACEELVTPIAGPGVADRVRLAFDMIEKATEIIDTHDIGFTFPVPGVVMKHYDSDQPVPAWWSDVRDLYLAAMNEMYRANQRSLEGGRPFTLYFARRLEFAFEYLNCIESVRKAGLARREKNTEVQRAELEKAVESMYSALGALAAVARSNSDRGVIAVLNEYGYRPLKKEFESLETR